MKKFICSALFLGVLFCGCEEIIGIPDISDSRVVLVAPGDSVQVNQNILNFTWETVDEATKYQVQVATPNFGASTAVQVVADSTLTGTTFTSNALTPGSYQWRVRGINDGFETPYSTRNFFVNDSVPDISQSLVTLIAPANNITTTDTILTFTWESLPGAVDYKLQLARPSFAEEESIQVVADTALTGTSYQSGDLDISNYEWRVKARNSSSETQYTTRSFEIQE